MSTRHNACVVAAILLCVSTTQAATIHVDAANCPGPGDGSVGDPYCEIQTAIDNVVDTDEIVVAEGTYFENINFIGKAITLHSSDGPEVTIIDGTGFFHVVQCVSDEGPDTILDGFTITGGNADGACCGPDSRGGGMFNDGSSPTVIHCTFIANSATVSGGGMSNFDNSSPTVTNCTFSGNSVLDRGGGMSNFGGSNPTVTSCTFTGNSASGSHGGGGGMFNHGSNPTVTNCVFSGNIADEFGGGMYNDNSSSPAVTNCTFSGNTAAFDGGGMLNYFDSNPTVTDCSFSENSALSRGGGMFNLVSSPTVSDCSFSENSALSRGGGMGNFGSSGSSGSLTVTNCSFSGNTAHGPFGSGGGMYNFGASPTVTNCTFTGNTTSLFGGGMRNNISSPTVANCTFSGNSATDGGGMANSDSSPTVTNCTFSGNVAAIHGGAMANVVDFFQVPSHPTITNCVCWGNGPDEIFDDSGSESIVQYSTVEGGFPGPGNIDADPLFVDPLNDDFRLSPGSPCIDTGDNTAVPEFVLRDLDGNPRFVADACAGESGATVDMGAYEFQGTSCDLGTMLEMLAAWGSCSDCGTCPADFNGDCSVGILDLLILLGNWTV